MTYRNLLLIALLVFTAAPLVAQKQTKGVIHSTAKRAVPDSSFTIKFQDTPVGQTSIEDCFYDCFYQIGTPPDSCNYSGTIDLVKTANPPFRVLNLRKSTVTANNCNGTPVTFPVTLQAGERLLQDFSFSPTVPGSFTDSFVYNVTPAGSPSDAANWILVGATPAAPPTITSFAAVPSSVRFGQQTTLTWTTSNALTVSIDNGVGAQPQSGSVTVSPVSNTVYTLTATNTVSSSTSTATVVVIITPTLVVNAHPAPIVQLANTGGTTTSFTVANTGGSSSTITVAGGNFFSVSPTSFTLSAGSTQTVTVTANTLAAGVFEGFAQVSGSGFNSQLLVPVKVLSSAPPSGSVIAKPVVNRVDTSVTPSGTVSFRNSGNATLTGVLVSDVPWLIPQSGIVTIPPNSTATFTFTIDRTKRSDSGIGSTAGSISLVYLSGSSPKTRPLDATPPPSISLVTVVDTPPLTVTTGGPPPLTPGEVALFVPGVGHITGSVGVFISDLSVLNPPGNPVVNDIRFFYSGAGGAAGNQKSTSLPAVANTSVALADVVKNVFTSDEQVGSLQVRSASAKKLVVNTNIFNSSNPAGTYGTSIPTFRSDRAAAAGDRLVLAGIRQDSGAHTNFFIQETAGAGVTVQTEFLSASGTSLGTRSDNVGAFALSQINSPAPQGTVAAIMTNTGTQGSFLAYATPVDNVSGDNWSVADWARQFGYSGDDPVIIPVAGVLSGANNTFFRTDVTITNTGSASASGMLEFFPRGGAPVTKTITLGGRQSTILNDVIGTFFNAPNGSVGYLLFSPTVGAFALTNRTYTTAAGSTGTFGSAAPVIAANGMLKTGSLRAIGSLQDSARTTTVAATPATFRTNIGMVETSGNSATVRVTLTFSYPSGAKLQASGTAYKDYALGPNQFLQVNAAVGDILGASRDSLGDLRGLEFDFQVISGAGAVAVYASSVDNGTGDSILRTE